MANVFVVLSNTDRTNVVGVYHDKDTAQNVSVHTCNDYETSGIMCWVEEWRVR